MRELALIALGWLAACGASSSDGPTLGGPCSLKAPCNKGEVCDMTADGGPICITGTGDLDGDGLTNDKDFCEHMSGGQYDEDQDGIGDDCDHCPIAPPRDTPDPDGDNVDSPCDPDPHTAGDEILLFDPFNGTALDTRWKPTTATVWRQQGGEVIATAPVDAAAEDNLATNVIGKSNISIEASYRIDAVPTSATVVQRIVSLRMSDPRPAGVAQMSCGVTKTDGGQGELVLVETNQSAMNMIVTGAFESANLYHAGGYVSGTNAGCSVISNGNPLGIVQASITPDQLSSIALTARAVTVRFQYILVVGH